MTQGGKGQASARFTGHLARDELAKILKLADVARYLVETGELGNE